MSSLMNSVRVVFTTLAIYVFCYMLHLVEINFTVVRDNNTFFTFFTLLFIVLAILLFLGSKRRKCNDVDSLYKVYGRWGVYSKWKYIVLFCISFVLTYFFSYTVKDYSTTVVQSINNACVSAGVTPNIRLVFLSLPCWVTTSMFGMYLDVPDLTKHIFTTAFFSVICGYYLLRVLTCWQFAYNRMHIADPKEEE